MKKIIFVVQIIIFILLFFAIKSNIKLKNELKSCITVDSVSYNIDTIIITKTDTLMFKIQKPTKIFYDTINNNIIEYVKQDNVIYKEKIIYKDSTNVALLNYYVDSLINKDGTFYSYSVVDGKMYSSLISYTLSDLILNKTITNYQIDTVYQNKKEFIQLYGGVDVFLADNINNAYLIPNLTLIFKEDFGIGYSYDFFNKQHGIKLKKRITFKNKHK